MQCFFVERFFVETVDRSGRTLRKGDVLVVRKLDRLSRSLRDVLTIMERLPEAKAGFRSLIEAIDATTRLVVVLGEVLPPDTPKIRPSGKCTPGAGADCSREVLLYRPIRRDGNR